MWLYRGVEWQGIRNKTPGCPSTLAISDPEEREFMLNDNMNN